MKKKLLLITAILTISISGCGSGNLNSSETNNNTSKKVVDSSQSNDVEKEDDGLEEASKPTPEEEAELEKERDESLTVYADMINEIQTDIPELVVEYVSDTKDGGKDITIHMELLESKDATTRKMAELATTKETLLNDNGITEIMIFIDHNGENVGIVMFANENGRYEPTVNTL